MRTRVWIGTMVLVLGMAGGALAASSSSEPERVGVVDAAIESLTGDVYAEPSKWRPLSLGTFFSEGWDQAWASPINGSGGAPRQGWIGAADGVFYRLGIGTFSYAHDSVNDGDSYNGGVTFYTPLSRRFELRYDLPIISSNKDASGKYKTAAGDLAITPRVILSECQDLTQSFGVSFRAPTGNADNGNGIAAITPATSSGRIRGTSSSCAAAPRWPSPTDTTRSTRAARATPSARSSPPATTSPTTT